MKMHDQGFIHTHNYMTGIRFDKQPFYQKEPTLI